MEDVRVWTFSPERTCEEEPSPPGFVEWASPCPDPTAAPRLRPGGGRAGVPARAAGFQGSRLGVPRPAPRGQGVAARRRPRPPRPGAGPVRHVTAAPSASARPAGGVRPRPGPRAAGAARPPARSAPAAPPPAAPRAPAPGSPAAGAASRWTKAAAAAGRAAVSVGGVAGRAGGLGWGSRTRGTEVGGRGSWSARGDGVPAAPVPAGDRPGPRRAGPGDRVEGPGASGRNGRGRRRAGGNSSGSLAGLGGPSPGAGRLEGDLPRLLSPRASTPSGARPRERPQRRSQRGNGEPPGGEQGKVLNWGPSGARGAGRGWGVGRFPRRWVRSGRGGRSGEKGPGAHAFSETGPAAEFAKPRSGAARPERGPPAAPSLRLREPRLSGLTQWTQMPGVWGCELRL